MSDTFNEDSQASNQHGEFPESELKSKTTSSTKVRRRNRMITSCLECRRRKLKCDKLQPCTNCNKFSRDCMFLGPALDSVSQQKLNEIKEKMGSLEKVLEQKVARQGSSSKDRRDRKSSVDLPGEAESSSDDDSAIPEDEKGLKQTPLAVVDGSYEDDADDEILDLGIKIGRMRMTERLGGLFRPKMSEELNFTLSNPQSDARTVDEKLSAAPQLADEGQDFLQPGASYIAPGSGFIFGDIDRSRNLIDFLPTRAVSDVLIKKYYQNVHFLARVVHWPSFQLQYDNFWTNILAGIEPPASQQALILSVLFCTIASMAENDVVSLFTQHKHVVLSNFQKGTEIALSKAHFLRTTKIDTLQALVIYLIPMCRDQMSRAHSVLVGTAIRLAECMGLHRDPADVYGLPPVECQIRRALWFQLCFLDFRTGETQGPRPCINREDYDTRFPLNMDDTDLMAGKTEESTTRWTDMTLSRIRFECNEMHRITWCDRNRLEKKKVSLTHVLGKIESFRKAMEAKYTPIIDQSIPIQKYAHLVLKVLLLRMHIMILHRYHNHWNMEIPDRLTQIILTSGTNQMEAAVELDKRAELAPWRWYSGANHQYHTVFLLIVELYNHPNRREADRIWKIIDFVFEPDLSLSRTQKARAIIKAVQDRTAVYRDLRRIRAPVSMRTDDVLKPKDKGSQPCTQAQDFNAPFRRTSGSSPTHSGALPSSNGSTSIDAIARSAADVPGGLKTEHSTSWGFDNPATFFIKPPSQTNHMTAESWNPTQLSNFHITSDSRPAMQQTTLPVPSAATIPQLDFSSPSEGSTTNESWPPMIAHNQAPWQMAQSMPANIHILNHNFGAFPQNTTSGMTNEGLYSTTNNQYQQQQQYLSPEQNQQQQRHLQEYQIHNQQAALLGGMTMQGIPTNAPTTGGTGTTQDDALMLDIDWNEWDKIFPPEQNNGNLDLSPASVQV